MDYQNQYQSLPMDDQSQLFNPHCYPSNAYYNPMAPMQFNPQVPFLQQQQQQQQPNMNSMMQPPSMFEFYYQKMMQYQMHNAMSQYQMNQNMMYYNTPNNLNGHQSMPSFYNNAMENQYPYYQVPAKMEDSDPSSGLRSPTQEYNHHHHQRHQEYNTSTSAVQRRRKRVNKPYQDTKNVPKNYTKAILRYLKHNQDVAVRLLGGSLALFKDFIKLIEAKKDKIISIKEFRSLFSNQVEGNESDLMRKVFRIMAFKFCREEVNTYLKSNRKIKQNNSMFKYRRVITIGLHDPDNFYSWKVNFLNPNEEDPVEQEVPKQNIDETMTVREAELLQHHC